MNKLLKLEIQKCQISFREESFRFCWGNVINNSSHVGEFRAGNIQDPVCKQMKTTAMRIISVMTL